MGRPQVVGILVPELKKKPFQFSKLTPQPITIIYFCFGKKMVRCRLVGSDGMVFFLRQNEMNRGPLEGDFWGRISKDGKRVVFIGQMKDYPQEGSRFSRWFDRIILKLMGEEERVSDSFEEILATYDLIKVDTVKLPCGTYIRVCTVDEEGKKGFILRAGELAPNYIPKHPGRIWVTVVEGAILETDIAEALSKAIAVEMQLIEQYKEEAARLAAEKKHAADKSAKDDVLSGYIEGEIPLD